MSELPSKEEHIKVAIESGRARNRTRHPFLLKDNKTIGQKVMDLRLEQGLTLRQAAELAGIYFNTFKKFESTSLERSGTITLGKLCKIVESVGGTIRISIVKTGHPKRAAPLAAARASRLSRRPYPKIEEGDRNRALGRGRYPLKRVLRPRYP